MSAMCQEFSFFDIACSSFAACGFWRHLEAAPLPVVLVMSVSQQVFVCVMFDPLMWQDFALFDFCLLVCNFWILEAADTPYVLFFQAPCCVGKSIRLLLEKSCPGSLRSSCWVPKDIDLLMMWQSKSFVCVQNFQIVIH